MAETRTIGSASIPTIWQQKTFFAGTPMLYFYLWVLFLLSISLAVPVMAYVEKSRVRKAAGDRAAAVTEEGGDAVGFEDAAGEEVAVDEGLEDFGNAVPASADDFTAFDDFK